MFFNNIYTCGDPALNGQILLFLSDEKKKKQILSPASQVWLYEEEKMVMFIF